MSDTQNTGATEGQNVQKPSPSGKSPLLKWLLILVFMGVLVYVLAYFFVIRKGTPQDMTGQTSTSGQSQQNQVTGNTQKTAVSLTGKGFVPQTVTIKKGEEVVWTNNSGEPAAINSNPHPIHTDYPPLNLGEFQNGDSLSLIFPTAGTYKYHNHLNPSETGMVIVQ